MHIRHFLKRHRTVVVVTCGSILLVGGGAGALVTSTVANAQGEPTSSAVGTFPVDTSRLSAADWNPLGVMALKANGWGQAPGTVGAPGAVAPGAVVAPDTNIATQVISSNALLKLVRKYFPANETGNAMAVAQCESGQASVQGDVNFDGTVDWGVFQLNDGGSLQGALAQIGYTPKDKQAAVTMAMNPTINVRAAAAMFANRGWAPWVCAYKQQIVASLWSSTPGPMYGKFTPIGTATGIPTVTKPKPKQPKKPKQEAPAKPPKKPVTQAPPAPKPEPAPACELPPSPSPDESESPTPTPVC